MAIDKNRNTRSKQEGVKIDGNKTGAGSRNGSKPGGSVSWSKQGESMSGSRQSRSTNGSKQGGNMNDNRQDRKSNDTKQGRNSSIDKQGSSWNVDKQVRSLSDDKQGRSSNDNKQGRNSNGNKQGVNSFGKKDATYSSNRHFESKVPEGKQNKNQVGKNPINKNKNAKTKGIINWDMDALEKYEDFDDLVDFEDFKSIGKSGEKGYKAKSKDIGNNRSVQRITDRFQKDRNTFGKSDTTKFQNNRSEAGKGERGRSAGNKNDCPVARKCGGCQLMHLTYDKQLALKQTQVEDLLKKYAKVEPIIGMENPLHYRNKVHAVFDHDRKGNPISGVYEAGTHRVVPVESCLIEDKKADEIIGTIRGMLKSFKIKTYDEDTEFGLLRHVLIRKGFKSGEIMVVLVLSSPIFPSKSNFVKALLKQHPEITTIILNVNNKNTSMILGDKEQVIYGKGFIEDTLCGKTFRISPKSFYQVNTVQTEVLYKKAIDLARLKGDETMIDAYCGIGTIGLIASDHVKKVIGVELNQDAVRDADMNAKRNQITNVDFYNKDAGEFMSQMAEQNESVDVVFMDPPRAGSDEKFLESMCSMNPKKVVYISCNPITLERDLGYLVKKKYKVERIVPVDMFPGTNHVETCCLLYKVK